MQESEHAMLRYSYSDGARLQSGSFARPCAEVVLITTMIITARCSFAGILAFVVISANVSAFDRIRKQSGGF